MIGKSATHALEYQVRRWYEGLWPRPDWGPLPPGWGARYIDDAELAPLRSPAPTTEIKEWERRHGFALPSALRVWLSVSNGLYHQDGPVIHPIHAIGPMVPFASVPGLLVQPEGWFELGNPGRETICVDLSYRWPGGDCPVFTSGDDQRCSRPRIIATRFDDWLGRFFVEGGREFWFDDDFASLGDPWTAHRRFAPVPELPDWLRPLTDRVVPLLRLAADERAIAAALGISALDVEALLRYLQHAPST
jgi:hypothetical protein